jgi:primosomal replication protein N
VANRVELTGALLTKGPLRFTPAGVPVVEFSLRHLSDQEEAGANRQVACEIACVALGPPAGLLNSAALNTSLKVVGFLAAKSLKNRALALHINEIEFIEGYENGIQTVIRSR